jgi:hypothetical protein
MATFTVFDEAILAITNGDVAIDSDTFKMMLITSATAPTASTATPAKADFTEVTAGGNYASGGFTLTMSVTEAAGTVTVDATTDPTWAQDGSNPTDARYAVMYNDTNAGKEAIGFVDLGSTIDLSAGDLTLQISASGLFTIG